MSGSVACELRRLTDRCDSSFVELLHIVLYIYIHINGAEGNVFEAIGYHSFDSDVCIGVRDVCRVHV